ncbi:MULTISPECIES: AbrB/MazE/SpoVT family DNA-binding domain-containing protein [Nitrosomonas]|uniref:SpoVT-AbrB domain-containing protein n=1 Tax=Nitrosomonas europaea (strain ATCC 19718 / CIP 103999 / KCTC 2705 / NBRC 14298) TaxID=228410 RepID=Q82XX4_NITEU|nr:MULTISPECIES: AbrB/MazE/SpoVT family DNA-binding domain-containing protein [Nitrosomonas]CAD84029.1 hypothetical protein NE0118 [Nitrosomonas europaea ATCC 19718]SDW01494.1 looped-hinge helix DNA binding domain-containing protein, AbrB family [Nitrosomonas europaea]SES65293.1 looped-hinge helix DNA binding domain-containing protein, AbrB family [Nitrosomonas europaea]SJZ29783.1 looped-hinge helix DNA binding domain-containing protein, AbrB family [Nitrosomonas europaea]HBF24950.1 AbrB/MazE/
MNSAILSQDGRVVIPKKFRNKLEIKEGDEVIWKEEDEQIILTSRRQELERAERFFGQMMADYAGDSLADELIAERRAGAIYEHTSHG